MLQGQRNADVPMRVHPSAVVEDGARLGARCVIHAQAIVGRHCRLGDDVVVHPFAVLGGDPQDLSFNPAVESAVHIGARTVVREHVTVNRATQAGAATAIGTDCFLMTACHVAHDCRLGDGVIVANAVLLGGHVHIGDRAFLGGGAVIHQHCRIGQGVMVGGAGRVSLDVPPFCMVTERNRLIGLNLVGLRRRRTPRAALTELKRAWQLVNVAVGNQRDLAAAALESGAFECCEARQFLEFFAVGKRGFVRARQTAGSDDLEET